MEDQVPELQRRVTLKRLWLALSNLEGVTEGVNDEGEEVKIPRKTELQGELFTFSFIVLVYVCNI